jgi:hypothetical protein
LYLTWGIKSTLHHQWRKSTYGHQYTISNLTQDVSINVNFSKITFTIAPLAYVNNAVLNWVGGHQLLQRLNMVVAKRSHITVQWFKLIDVRLTRCQHRACNHHRTKKYYHRTKRRNHTRKNSSVYHAGCRTLWKL